MMKVQAKIYLAGPGVFSPDCKQWGEHLKTVCTANGLEGLYPRDREVPVELRLPDEKRRWIFASDCELIRQADAVFADMRSFRSDTEPDSGTAFMVGFAHALGKPVWLWLPDCPPGSKLIGRVACAQDGDFWVDAEGMIVEDFGVPLNLMLWEAAAGVSYDPEVEIAIQQMAQQLGNTTLVSRET